MRKKLYIAIILFLLFGELNAQYQVKTKFIIENELGDKIDKLIFGIHSQASDSVDLDLGENYDLPPPPPQSVLYGYFTITNPRTNEKTSSFLDLRGVKEEKSFFVKFHLRTQRGNGEKLFFKWMPLTYEQVDSAYLTDVVTEKVIRVNLVEKDTCIIDNPMINQFYVQVWYKNPFLINVKEYKNIPSIKTIDDNIIFSNDFQPQISELYDINGNLVIQSANKNIINIDNISKGVYILISKSIEGIILRQKIMKY